jgi:hypothetical protein
MSDLVDVAFDWKKGADPEVVVGDLLEVLREAGVVLAGKMDPTMAQFRIRITDEKTRKEFLRVGMRGVRRREVE